METQETINQLVKDDLSFDNAVISQAEQDFTFFYDTIWRDGIEKLEGDNTVDGEHISEWCDIIVNKDFLGLVAPRKHLKSTITRAYIAWLIFTADNAAGLYTEIFYFSYTQSLAGEHLRRIKKIIGNSKYFRLKNIKDLTSAETIIKYKVGNKIFECHPEGILGASRGRHPHGVICDDILKDPSQKLDRAVIQKITRLFFEEIVSLPKEGGFLKVVGTPQDEKDLFSRLRELDKYFTKTYRAVMDWKKEKVLWEKKFSFARLMEIRNDEIGEKAFEKEYQCAPVHSMERYVSSVRYDQLTNSELRNWTLKEISRKKELTEGDFTGGFDIGKKTHPSHLAVFKKTGEKYIQLISKWMDGWNYTEQIEYLNRVCEILNPLYIQYDNTRSEFEGFEERGELRPALKPVTLSGKKQYELAANLDKIMTHRNIEFVYDERQRSQVLAVDNDLHAPSTAEGHGDCYDDQTEILTDSGWKLFKDLNGSEKVVTLNNKNNEIEYQKPKRIIEKNYKGKMYSIETTQVSLKVTPQHKMFVANSQNKYKLRFPYEIENKQVKYKKNGIWKGKEKKFFTLPGSRIKPEIKINMNLWMEFLGLYISEGHTTKRRRGRYQIGISQEKNREWVRDILGKMPIKYTENKKGFWIYDSRLGKILYPLGKSAAKYIPKEIKNISSSQLKILLENMIIGDGIDNGKNHSYYTSSKKLADDVQELALKCGWSANIYRRNFIGRKAPHGITRNICFNVSIIKEKNNPTVNGRKSRDGISDKWVNYDGKIYCVTVPNRIIYVRRKGKPVWSGNSFWTIVLAISGHEKKVTNSVAGSIL